MIKNRKYSALGKATLIGLFTLLIVSCKKEDNKDGLGAKGPAKIAVKASSAEFDDVVPIENMGKSANVSESLSTGIQTATTDLNEDFIIISELKAVSKAEKGGNGLKTAAEQGDMEPMMRYKIAVFDASGNYVTEKDYKRTQETSTEDLMLDGGSSYTFIAYSVNSTTDLPAISWTNPSNKTLAGAKLSMLGNADAMYYRKDMVVSAGAENVLDITFKHLFSQITTTIDATATGYDVTWVNSMFRPHMPNATISLVDANVNRTGTATDSKVAFNTYHLPVITSEPTMINTAATTTGEFYFYSLQVGPLTKNVFTPFTDLDLRPGVKYNLTLRVVPTDEYLTWEGHPAVRLNGDIWARHNLGVNTTLDPDLLPITSDRHGNYYQWGALLNTGTGTTNMQNGNFVGRDPVGLNLWNSGTESNPIKTALDPCPNHFRVPTKNELQRLIDATVGSTIGDRSDNSTNFSGAAILTSKRKAGIKMTIPAQGRLRIGGAGGTFSALGIGERGANALFWTSLRRPGSGDPRSWAFNGGASGSTAAFETHPGISYNLRCVAIQ